MLLFKKYYLAKTTLLFFKKALDANQTKELQATLQTLVKKGSKLQVEMKVNPQIMGGMIVEIGDRYIDMSISSKLRVYSEMVQEANV